MMMLAIQAVVMGAIVLLLFHFRSRFGLVPLYVFLGALQAVQTLCGSILVDTGAGIAVSPGSAIFFSAGLFAVLLVYIREDAIETRKLIYALVIANAAICALLVSVAWQSEARGTINLTGVSAAIFLLTARNLMIGTALLAVDAFLLVILYEFFARRLSGLFAPIVSTMIIVLTLDSLAYISFTFWARPDFMQLLDVSVASKAMVGLWFATAMVFYLRRFEREQIAVMEGADPRDIFSILTYRQKYELASAAATRDGLTGIFNRAYFNTTFDRAIRDAIHDGRSLAVLFVDIDHFKRINDDHGHAVGDQVIKAVAHMLSEPRRSTDWVCRYGGEEFVVVLPDTETGAAVRVAESIRAAIDGMRWVEDYELTLSVTIGVACLPGDATGADDLLHIADNRLYAGKRAGRNRVVSSD